MIICVYRYIHIYILTSNETTLPPLWADDFLFISFHPHTHLVLSLSSTVSGRRTLSLLAKGIYQVFAPTFAAAAGIMAQASATTSGALSLLPELSPAGIVQYLTEPPPLD